MNEVTSEWVVKGQWDDIVLFAAVYGAMTPEVQKATIASRYVKNGTPEHNADKQSFTITQPDLVIKAADESGLSDSGFTLVGNTISFLDFLDPDMKDLDFEKKMLTFVAKLSEYEIKFEEAGRQSVQSNYLASSDRREFLEKAKVSAVHRWTDRRGIYNSLIDQAIKRQESFEQWQGINESPEAARYRELRSKQIELGADGKVLPKAELAEIAQLEKFLAEPISAIIQQDQPLYNQAKKEIEAIAEDLAGLVSGGFKSSFPIKKPSRASIKTVRWYDAQPNLLGDGARTNVIVESDGDADFIFNQVNTRFGTEFERTENETTELGYPKRLSEVRISNGKLAEIQVMTVDGYLAKDGLDRFPKDERYRAAKRMEQIATDLGYQLPSGVGHWFYEINRDVNIPKAIRDKAQEVSNQYYGTFLNSKNPSATKEELIAGMKELNDMVVSADKTQWDAGNDALIPADAKSFIEGNQVVVEPVEEVLEKRIPVKGELFRYNGGLYEPLGVNDRGRLDYRKPGKTFSLGQIGDFSIKDTSFEGVVTNSN